MISKKSILGFIQHFRDAESTFLNGCCYWFANILYQRFQGDGAVYYDPVVNHFAWRYEDVYYDASGICDVHIEGEHDPWIPWTYYCVKNPYEARRISRDCILKEDREIEEYKEKGE